MHWQVCKGMQVTKCAAHSARRSRLLFVLFFVFFFLFFFLSSSFSASASAPASDPASAPAAAPASSSSSSSLLVLLLLPLLLLLLLLLSPVACSSSSSRTNVWFMPWWCASRVCACMLFLFYLRQVQQMKCTAISTTSTENSRRRPKHATATNYELPQVWRRPG